MSTDRLATALADRYRIERELGGGGMIAVSAECSSTTARWRLTTDAGRFVTPGSA